MDRDLPKRQDQQNPAAVESARKSSETAAEAAVSTAQDAVAAAKSTLKSIQDIIKDGPNTKLPDDGPAELEAASNSAPFASEAVKAAESTLADATASLGKIKDASVAATTATLPVETTATATASEALTTSASPAGADSSSTASPTNNPSSSSGGLSTGAAAGVAVGCLVAGLLIGLAAAWFLFRRRKQPQHHHQHSQPTPVAIVNEGKEHGGGSSTQSTPSHDNDIQLSQFLLEATPDQEIVDELQSLGSLIQQHVETMYHFEPVQAQPLKETLLAVGYADSGFGADTAVALCVDPRSRDVGLRHVISNIVFRSIDSSNSNGSGSQNSVSASMLPAPVGAFLQSMPAAEHGNVTATSLALSQWRRLSAFLLHPHPEHRTPLPATEAAVSAQAQALVAALNPFLALFKESDDGRHLQAVIAECAKLGYVLLSHPSDFRFVFHGGSPSTAVVCPGLEKLSQRDGVRLASPRRIVAPVTLNFETRG